MLFQEIALCVIGAGNRKAEAKFTLLGIILRSMEPSLNLALLRPYKLFPIPNLAELQILYVVVLNDKRVLSTSYSGRQQTT